MEVWLGIGSHAAVSPHRGVGLESAKADFVLLQPGFQSGGSFR